MQRLAPINPDRNPNGHTDAEVFDALTGRSGVRRFTFRYELLDAGHTYIEDLVDTMLSCRVDYNHLADIKRTAALVVRDRGRIDFLSDRIKPYVRTWLPPYGPNDFVEHPQGVFLLVSPIRASDENGVVTRSVECYDPLQVYSDDLIADRFTAAAGANYVTVATGILTSTWAGVPMVVTPSAKTLPTAKEWEPGTSKLRIINDLLGEINYESLSFDEEGRAVLQPYTSPQDRAEGFVYAAGESGLIIPGVEQELDLFAVPNKWVLVVSDPDREPLVATYTNTDPASPTSVVRRQRTITDYRTEQEAVDLATLQDKAYRLAFEASQIYEAIPFETGLMPIHSGNDVYRLRYPTLAVNAKYAEQTWSLELKAGSKMKHRARRVVTI